MGLDKDTGEVVLFIADHLSWANDAEHFGKLEKKIGGYLEFVNSGQLVTRLPEAQGRPVKISVMYEHRPPLHAVSFLEAARAQLESLGIRFSHQTLPKGY